ncbi:MAG: M23 family metallopeptidase [Caldilineaceae bacterium]|nr:M23 family metallopeptidase [Caldilineaceae bacterium]
MPNGIRIFYLMAIVTALCLMTNGRAAYAQLPEPTVYEPPLGYRDDIDYGPYPTTVYGVMNPDLPDNDTCFLDADEVPIKWPQLYHAGEDWFRLDGASGAGSEVTAIENGVVVWISVADFYPGYVVIIEHNSLAVGTFYSMYGHLADVELEAGSSIYSGERIGFVLDQPGQFGDNSHIHWEVRDFADAQYLNNYPDACKQQAQNAGKGYTPTLPNDYGYRSPTGFFDFMTGHHYIFMPIAPTPPHWDVLMAPEEADQTEQP